MNVEPCPGRDDDGDAAAERLDGPFHHVHADAAARDVRDGLSRGEARQEDEVVGLLVGQLAVGRDQPLLDRDGPHARAVDAGAVVRDLDHDPAGAMQGREPDLALLGLAGGPADLGLLQSVVDGVADHMGERVAQALDDGLVDLRPLALGDEADVLADLQRHFADQARHTLEHRFDRLGADRHDAVLDLARQLLEFVEADRDLRHAGEPGLVDPLGQHGLVDHQFAHEVDQAVDPFEVDPDGRRGLDGGLVLGSGRFTRRGFDGGRHVRGQRQRRDVRRLGAYGLRRCAPSAAFGGRRRLDR